MAGLNIFLLTFCIMTPQEESKFALVGILFFLIVLGGIALWRFDLLEPNISDAPLTASPEKYDFGEISMAKGNVQTKILLKNEGNKPLKITDVRTSCMCTIAAIDGVSFGMHKNPVAAFAIPAGESKEMTVTFDPNAHGPDAVGPIQRVVYIKTNSEKTPTLEMHFTGNVVK